MYAEYNSDQSSQTIVDNSSSGQFHTYIAALQLTSLAFSGLLPSVTVTMNWVDQGGQARSEALTLGLTAGNEKGTVFPITLGGYRTLTFTCNLTGTGTYGVAIDLLESTF